MSARTIYVASTNVCGFENRSNAAANVRCLRTYTQTVSQSREDVDAPTCPLDPVSKESLGICKLDPVEIRKTMNQYEEWVNREYTRSPITLGSISFYCL